MPRPKSPPAFSIAVLGLFAVVRGYNIALIVLAQYLTSIYILAPEKPLLTVLLDPQLFALVMATALTAAAGFIINNFYDDEKDRINRPQKYLLEHLLSLRTQGWLYVLLNFAALLAAAWVSWMAFLFFYPFYLALQQQPQTAVLDQQCHCCRFGRFSFFCRYSLF